MKYINAIGQPGMTPKTAPHKAFRRRPDGGRGGVRSGKGSYVPNGVPNSVRRANLGGQSPYARGLSQPFGREVGTVHSGDGRKSQRVPSKGKAADSMRFTTRLPSAQTDSGSSTQ